MRTAGVREARQHLTALLEEVRKGRTVVITDRGRPVARLVPAAQESARPVASRKAARSRVALRGAPLTDTIAAERDDRV